MVSTENLAPELIRKVSQEKILSFLLYIDGKPVVEHYKNGKVKHSLQTINSCTKSVMSMLIGILIDQGLLSIETPISQFFPEVQRMEETKQSITVKHLLEMSAGYHWPELGEWHSFAPMVYSSNIIGFILDRQLNAEPGRTMNYNSGCSHLLSAIVQAVSGQSTHDFAKRHLFDPLGITKSLWHEKQGVCLGADGLRISSKDMATLGQLYLDQGFSGGQQVVSGQWVELSTTPRHLTYKNIGHYGYHWWVSSHREVEVEVGFYFALGLGGQYIIVVPKHRLVAVFTSRMYHDTMWPLRFFRSHVLSPLIQELMSGSESPCKLKDD